MKRILGGAIASLLLMGAGPALAARTIDLDFENGVASPGGGWWEDGASTSAPRGEVVDGVLVVARGQYGHIMCCSPLNTLGANQYTLSISSITFLSESDVHFRLYNRGVILYGSPNWQTINFAPGEFRTVGGFSFAAINPSVIMLDRITFTAVPEPATWAMMITGFGLAGTALRRRRETAAA